MGSNPTESYETETNNMWDSFLFLLMIRPPPNCFLCWDRWNGDLMPTLDAALLCRSRAGSNLGRESGLVLGAI